MVGDAEVGVDQILNRLDGARIAQFVHLHPNAVFHHFVENMERFRLLRVRFPSAIFHDMKFTTCMLQIRTTCKRDGE